MQCCRVVLRARLKTLQLVTSFDEKESKSAHVGMKESTQESFCNKTRKYHLRDGTTHSHCCWLAVAVYSLSLLLTGVLKAPVNEIHPAQETAPSARWRWQPMASPAHSKLLMAGRSVNCYSMFRPGSQIACTALQSTHGCCKVPGGRQSAGQASHCRHTLLNDIKGSRVADFLSACVCPVPC